MYFEFPLLVILALLIACLFGICYKLGYLKGKFDESLEQHDRIASAIEAECGGSKTHPQSASDSA